MSEVRPDPAQIGAFWDAMVAPGDVHEVRIPKTRKGPARLWGTVSGYFSDREAFVKAVAPLTGEDAEGIYLTLNPVDPELLARACNRLVGGKPVTTADNDVTTLRYLLIDIDPVRKSGISSTDEELQYALRLRDQVQGFLREEWQWPEPQAVTVSGNGSALLYRIALENTAENVDVVRRVLLALHALFTDPTATIDTSNSNPSRLTKVLGTVAAKGDALPHRPWRRATGVVHGNPVEAVPLNALSAVAALASASAASGTNPTGGASCEAMPDVAGWLETAGIGFTEAEKAYATVYRLDRCLTSDDHTDGACILVFPSGALAYRCHHDRCVYKSWADVRDRLVPASPTIRSKARSPEGTFTEPRDRTEAPRSGGHAAETSVSDWPVLDPAALTGLAGEVVHTVSPHTEGDPVAVLANFLTMFGSAVGPSPHALVGATRHRANLFVVHVGETARARKGTAHAEAFRLVSLAAMHWDRRVMGGLSSGEGLIFAVRDATTKITKDGQEVPDDPGVEDRRLLAVEPEFSSVLRVARRDGSTLTEILRRAWDGDTLRTLTRNSPLKATGAHIAILGHITISELKRELTETSQLNGYANRHLFLCVRRWRLLPHGGSLSDNEVSGLARQIRTTLDTCRRITSVRRDAEANAMWEAVYPALTAERPGMFGATTARAEAQVLRLSLIYALLDGSATIRPNHLEAGLAVWQYAEDSARLIFADATGDPIADRLLAALRSNGPMTQSEIVDLFGRHTGAAKLGQAQEMLVSAGKIRSRKEETGGRPRVIWEAA